jgi:protein gp37
MGENSAIEWTHHTFNPWIGCTKVAEGCTHCYAEAFAKRYGKANWGPNGTRVKTSDANWRKPIKWNREAEAAGERRRVFCASLADVFEDWDGRILTTAERDEETGEPTVAWWTPDMGVVGAGQTHTGPLPPADRPATMNDLRRDLFNLIDATPGLDWLLLTKRPENIWRMWPDARHMPAGDPYRLDGYRPNAWLLTSIATQADADKNVPELVKCRDLVPVLGLSAEPLLGPVDLLAIADLDEWKYDSLRNWRWRKLRPDSPRHKNEGGIDWIIAGGESGHGARPMHPDWARSIRDQCAAAGVPFFFKQWGEWAPLEVCAEPAADWTPCGVDKTHLFDDRECVFRIGKKAAGRLLDGKVHDEYPAAEVHA